MITIPRRGLLPRVLAAGAVALAAAVAATLPSAGDPTAQETAEVLGVAVASPAPDTNRLEAIEFQRTTVWQRCTDEPCIGTGVTLEHPYGTAAVRTIESADGAVVDTACDVAIHTREPIVVEGTLTVELLVDEAMVDRVVVDLAVALDRDDSWNDTGLVPTTVAVDGDERITCAARFTPA